MQFGSQSSRHFVVRCLLYIYCLLCNNFNFQLAFSFSKTPHRRHDSSNYIDILASNAPLLDVRAPSEYIKGSFPNTYNLPLLNDEQRALIGTCYKEHGQDAAVALGYELLVDNKEGSLKESLVQSWTDHITLYPKGYLYCFRGGMRSHIVQEWIYETTGVQYPLVVGGYKAMRTSLLSDLEVSLEKLNICLIGGRTCSGKTIALKQMARFVDLEALANHRGSAFGAIAQEDQPAQIDFENSIIIELLKHRNSSPTLPVYMEDEGNRIGRVTLPVSMHKPMGNDFPLIILETPLHERIDICIEEYIQSPFHAYLDSGNANASDDNEEKAHARIRSVFLEPVGRIHKKLKRKWGGTSNEGCDIVSELERAFDSFKSTNASNVSGFRKPIQLLLEEYYDPMYDYQMSKREGVVLFRGSMKDIVKWACDHSTLN